MVLIVVFCASFFVPARTLIGVKLLIEGSNVRKRYLTIYTSPPPLFVDGERSKLTGRAERGVGSGGFGRGSKPARFLKRFWRPSAETARWIAANRVLPDSPSRILSGTYSGSL